MCRPRNSPLSPAAQGFLCLLSGAALLLGGCAPGSRVREHWMTKYSPEQHGTGKTDVKRHFNLHRGRWWNYYARGRWFLELGFPVEASRDLHRAIRSRSSDTRSARSYGMHFWDYFPRRELGISLFRQDRFREAIDQLQASLSSEESARAKYYLNRTRRALLERTGADARPPRIALELADGALVRGTTVVVRGTAEDDQFVRSVTVAGRTIFTEMAQRQIAFAEEVPLQPGKQTVEVTATDLVGQRTSLTITVTADLQPPTLSIDAAVVAESGHSITLDVSATDDVALREIRVGTTAVSCGGAPRRTFEGLRAELDGRKLRIMAVDTAGNVSEAEIDLPSLGLSSMPRPGGSAMLCSTGTAGGADPGDTASAPAIRLGARPPSGRLAVTDTVFFLDGKVHDPDGIAAIAVNGTAIALAGSKNVCVVFNRFIPLKVGQNPIELVAVDREGNRAKVEFVVERVEAEVFQSAARYRIALVPLQELGPKHALGGKVYDSILEALFVPPVRFTVVERRHEALEKLLMEQKLSKLADERTAIRIGRLVSAEGMLFGEMAEGSNYVNIDLRFVDAETRTILYATDIYAETGDPKFLEWCATGLVSKLKRNFPLLRGDVIDAEDGTLYVNIGSDRALRQGLKLLLYREERVGSHRLLKAIKRNGRQVEARVTDIGSATSSAELLDHGARHTIVGGDKVITK